MQRGSETVVPSPKLAPATIRLGATEWALIVLHSILWGSSFFFGAIAIRELPPLTITGFRAVPASIIVVAVCWAMGLAIPARLDYWRRMVLLALLNNIFPMMLILWAQHQVASGVAAVFNATTPLFAVVIAHYLTHDERFSWNKAAGLISGLAGVSVLVGADVTSGASGGLAAKIALLGAALCYALAGVFARTTSREPPFVIAAGQLVAALAMAMPLALYFDRPWTLPMPSTAAISAVAGIGILSSAFASLVYFTVIKRAGATNGLLVTLLLPLTPIMLGGLFLGEHLSRRELGGGLLIALALVVIDGRLLRRPFAR
jgi:drug/metabolite transporter (DMT)-like permease